MNAASTAAPEPSPGPSAAPPAWRYWFAASPLVSAVNFALTGLGLVLGAVTLPNHGWLWWFMGGLCVITFMAWWSAARAAADGEAQMARLAALHETLGGVAANIGEIKGSHPALAEALDRMSRLSGPEAPPAGAAPSPAEKRFENWTLRQRKKEMKQAARNADKARPGKKGG